ncbi:FkbM family methyltransferase [Thermosynechococcus sp. CL-1]|uniref:FkbM family methyltransferase n=1 Tax=Thermosynechococcus sp. CL-1 TaxID=2583530 RepID=UPI00122E9D5B|nr:FkbM family methyltransferase [Thermosynechococcus sp. CL-1]QEQ01511.1 FkbM family methyltransferase [Thermosynechococcus sp. CL-1]
MSSQDKPLVTFAVFAYNQEQFIREAIEGAFSQTYEPLEIILSDDCSSDRTFEIMQEMVANYKGKHTVIARRNPVNLMTAMHVSWVASEAKSQLLILNAGDCICHPQRVELIVQEWSKAGYKSPCLIHSDLHDFSGTVKKPNLTQQLTSFDYEERIKLLEKWLYKNQGMPFLAPTCAYTKDLFDNFAPLYSGVCEDGILFIRALMVASICYINKPLVKEIQLGVGTNHSYRNIDKWNKILMSRILTKYIIYKDCQNLRFLLDQDKYNLLSWSKSQVNNLSSLFLTSNDNLSIMSFILSILVNPSMGNFKNKIYFILVFLGIYELCKSKREATSRRIVRRIVQKLPKPTRNFLRALSNYLSRINHWFIIIRQIKAKTVGDNTNLLLSALYSLIVSSRNLLEWQDPQLIKDANVTVRNIGEFHIRAYSDDLWHVLPFREQAVLQTIRNKLQMGDFFIDSGANIGFYSVLASKLVGDTGKVLSIEMMPDTAAILNHHLQLNQCTNVEVIEFALSDQDNQEVIATVQEGKFGQATISKVDSQKKTDKEIAVKTITLDTLTKDISHIRLIKMDLEGAELQALQGAVLTLQKTDYLIFEERTREKEHNPVFQFLKKSGFELHQIDGNNWLAYRKGL